MIEGPDDTFPVGERFADLYTLVVTEGARGQGVGTRLLDAVDRELEARAIHALRISVLAGNERAQRLYERRGCRSPSSRSSVSRSPDGGRRTYDRLLARSVRARPR